jgi:hypothetical protein
MTTEMFTQFWIRVEDQQLGQPLALLHRITIVTAMHRNLKKTIVSDCHAYACSLYEVH